MDPRQGAVVPEEVDTRARPDQAASLRAAPSETPFCTSRSRAAGRSFTRAASSWTSRRAWRACRCWRRSRAAAAIRYSCCPASPRATRRRSRCAPSCARSVTTRMAGGSALNGGDVAALLPRVIAQIERRAVATGTPVRLVGWSLGGVLAREAARDRPELVERVVTLGSPIVGGPKYTAAGRSLPAARLRPRRDRSRHRRARAHTAARSRHRHLLEARRHRRVAGLHRPPQPRRRTHRSEQLAYRARLSRRGVCADRETSRASEGRGRAQSERVTGSADGPRNHAEPPVDFA